MKENSEKCLLPYAILVVLGGVVTFLFTDYENTTPWFTIVPFIFLMLRFGKWVWDNGTIEEERKRFRNLDMPPGGWQRSRYRNQSHDAGPGASAIADGGAACAGDGGGCGGGGE